MKDFSMFLPIGIDEEQGDKDGLNYKSNTVDRWNQNAIFLDDWKAIEHPHCTIQYCGKVGVWLEMLNRLGFPYVYECRPAFSKF